jgi:hypothetical protein
MSAFGSGCQSVKNAETEYCEIPVELGAIVRCAYLVPDTFETYTAQSENALKNAPSLPPLWGKGRGGNLLGVSLYGGQTDKYVHTSHHMMSGR